MLKVLGALLILMGCGVLGFRLADNCRREAAQLGQLRNILGWISGELQFRRTALPELLREAGEQARGDLKPLFLNVAAELDRQIFPDARACFACCLENAGLAAGVSQILSMLGRSLGALDLQGQLRQLSAAEEACTRLEAELVRNKADRIRIYQTMGLAAGGALAILLL